MSGGRPSETEHHFRKAGVPLKKLGGEAGPSEKGRGALREAGGPPQRAGGGRAPSQRQGVPQKSGASIREGGRPSEKWRFLRGMEYLREVGSPRKVGVPQRRGSPLREVGGPLRQGGPRTEGGPLREAEAPEKPGAPEAGDPPPAAPAPHSPKLLGASAGGCGAPGGLGRRGPVRSARVPRRRLPQVAPAAAEATGRRTTDRPTARAARSALGWRGCACARRGADPGREEPPRGARSHSSVSPLLLTLKLPASQPGFPGC